tara:strand:- start:1963 stop:2295 length:333 start_codon:yes stop_codon:yes gene_type:complete
MGRQRNPEPRLNEASTSNACLESKPSSTEWLELAQTMTSEHSLNGQPLNLKAASDARVAERVAQHLQRRIEEDDWRPYTSKEEALRAWIRLGGIRLQVMQALGLLNDLDA